MAKAKTPARPTGLVRVVLTVGRATASGSMAAGTETLVPAAEAGRMLQANQCDIPDKVERELALDAAEADQPRVDRLSGARPRRIDPRDDRTGEVPSGRRRTRRPAPKESDPDDDDDDELGGDAAGDEGGGDNAP